MSEQQNMMNSRKLAVSLNTVDFDASPRTSYENIPATFIIKTSEKFNCTASKRWSLKNYFMSMPLECFQQLNKFQSLFYSKFYSKVSFLVANACLNN